MTPIVIHRWINIVDNGRTDELADLLAEDAVFYSPAVFTPQEGKAVTLQYLTAAAKLFANTDFGYLGQWYGERSAVLEFAVEALGVEHIIVCGHTHCGGVEAILDQNKLNPASSLARWLSWIEPARSQVDELGVGEEERYLETIKANVLLQRQNVQSYPNISEALESGRLMLHAWLFDLETGNLTAYDDAASKWLVVNPPKHKEALDS